MSREIDKLKAYRAPWWARLYGAYQARRRQKAAMERKVLVATLREWTRWTDIGGVDCNVYMLYRNGRGERSYKHYATSQLLDGNEKRRHVYHRIVKPWIDGADCSDTTLKKWEEQTERHPKPIAASK